MNIEDRLSNTEAKDVVTEDITCGQCGKMTGKEKVGTSWICSDCKVSEDTTKSD